MYPELCLYLHCNLYFAKMGSSTSSLPDREPHIMSQRWTLVARPQGLLKVDDMKLVSEKLDSSSLKEGEAIVQCEVLSVDAFLRTMLDAEAYHGSISLNDTVPALGYGTIIASANPKLKCGSRVTGMLGACDYTKVRKEQAAMLFPMIKIPYVPLRTSLGLLGITSGITAWVGIYAVAKPPRRGETVLVSGASGATGSVAAQFAKLSGAQTFGIAGGSSKCSFMLDKLGLAGAIDYKNSHRTVGEQLDEMCPNGIDFYFDTVGGELLDEVLRRLNRNARVIICGASSQYNGNLNVGLVRGPSEYLKLAEKGAQMIGFNVMFYLHRVPGAMLHILWLMFRGKIFMPEQIEKGIESFPAAMVKMFTGGHIGKLLIDVKRDESSTAVEIKKTL